jgi:tubulin--tyrosine ligase
VGRAPAQGLHAPAHALGARIVNHLWTSWGADPGGLRANEVDLYNVNIPMVPALGGPGGIPVLWTRIWRNRYGRLFKRDDTAGTVANVSAAGPGAAPDVQTAQEGAETEAGGKLVFKFSPDMGGLIGARLETLPEGSDGWAMEKGWASVTPLRASFAEPESAEVFCEGATLDDKLVKMRL